MSASVKPKSRCGPPSKLFKRAVKSRSSRRRRFSRFNTWKRFKSVLAKWPIEIRSLNRFVSKRDQTKTLEDLKNGKVDIVIGTHRLLSQDVVFKDLGLLVIDEEQRFGVKHKER